MMNHEKKLKYEEPKMDIIAFDAEDVIRTSGFAGDWDEEMGPEEDAIS